MNRCWPARTRAGRQRLQNKRTERKKYVIHNCGSPHHSVAARSHNQLHAGRDNPRLAGGCAGHDSAQPLCRAQRSMTSHHPRKIGFGTTRAIRVLAPWAWRPRSPRCSGVPKPPSSKSRPRRVCRSAKCGRCWITEISAGLEAPLPGAVAFSDCSGRAAFQAAGAGLPAPRRRPAAGRLEAALTGRLGSLPYMAHLNSYRVYVRLQ